MSTRIEELLTDKELKAVAAGNCYQSAAEYLMKNPTEDLVLVHGRPILQGGEHAGLEYGHAWVEKHSVQTLPNGAKIEIDIVIDTESGNEMPLALYYYAGQIDPELSRRYTLQETRQNLVEKGVYGPWE